jgi:hypothetical protein
VKQILDLREQTECTMENKNWKIILFEDRHYCIVVRLGRLRNFISIKISIDPLQFNNKEIKYIVHSMKKILRTI